MTLPTVVSDAPVPAPSALVALPGTGSDADYARRAFAPLAHALDVEFIAVDPGPEGIEVAYRRALDHTAARHRHLVVAGVSVGACVGVDWAVDREQCVGVFAALPPWLDSARDAPASHSARATADLIDRSGLRGAIDTMVASSPAWLGDELARSWASIGPALRTHLDEATKLRLPTRERIAGLRVPLVIVAATGDPVHPFEVAGEWADHARVAVLRSVTLDQWGADASVLGRECVLGWHDAVGAVTTSDGQRP